MYEKLFLLQEEVFKVLANQKRLEIIQLLAGGELSVSQMIDMLDLPQANLSQHLAYLRQVGAVDTRREGVVIYYTLRDTRLAQACGLVRQFLQDQNKLDERSQKLLSSQAGMYPVVKDVVCGMRISVRQAGAHMEHGGHDYYFCASGCKNKFDRHPKKYEITGKDNNNG